MTDATKQEPTRKVMTFISRSSPYHQGRAKACLDMILSAAVFDQQVNLLFMDDGVYQLQEGQQADAIEAKDVAAAFPALALYDIDKVYFDRQSVAERGLNATCFFQGASALETAEVAELIRQSDLVFTL